MSLIQKHTTEAMVAANRGNSLKSTGPLTDPGKINVSLNALKHGMRARTDGLVVAALGEQEGDLRKAREQLQMALQPQHNFEYLLQNRWRRQHAVRAEAGILNAQRRRFEVDYGQRLAGEGRSAADAGQASLPAASGLVALPDSPAKFNLILQCLRAAQEAVEREGFGQEGLRRLEAVYGREPGLAGAALMASYQEYGQASAAAEAGTGKEDAERRPAFLASLEAEIGCFQKLLELHEMAEGELAKAVWEAQGLLSEADSKRLTRYEAFLDRQFQGLLKQFHEWRDRSSRSS